MAEVSPVNAFNPAPAGEPDLDLGLVTTTGLGPVPRYGLGTFPLSDEGRPADQLSIRILHAAWDAGVRLVDTANNYHLSTEGPGHGELLIRRALDRWSGDRGSVRIATKGGREYHVDGQRYCAGRPERIVTACEASLDRLGVDQIDLYYFHRPDPEVSYADSIGALVELHERGLISAAGISNADPDQIRTAYELLGPALLAVQNQLSPWFRTSEPDLDLCDELGLLFVPWSPFGGAERATKLVEEPTLARVANEHDATVHQIVLAWLTAKSPNVVLIPGVRRLSTLANSLEASQIELSAEGYAAIEALTLT